MMKRAADMLVTGAILGQVRIHLIVRRYGKSSNVIEHSMKEKLHPSQVLTYPSRKYS